MTELATWTPVEAEVERAPDAGAPGWVPQGFPRSIVRRMAEADRAERQAAREAERARVARAEETAAAALDLYRRQCEERGDEVTAMALATGQGIGRSIGDVLAGALQDAEYQDAVAAARDRHQELVGFAEPQIGRSDWPESPYQLQRLIDRAEADRQWLLAYRMRLASRQGRAEEHVSEMRAEAHARRDRRENVTRSRSFDERVDDLMAKGYSYETARLACTPVSRSGASQSEIARVVDTGFVVR